MLLIKKAINGLDSSFETVYVTSEECIPCTPSHASETWALTTKEQDDDEMRYIRSILK